MCVALSAVTAHAGAAGVTSYPMKPVRWVVPYPAGAVNDVIARTVAQKLTALWGTQIVIDNRTGAGGIIGTEMAARADADGHTLIIMSGTNAVQPALYPKLPYDLTRENYTRLLWLFEGVTSYYDDLALVRCGQAAN